MKEIIQTFDTIIVGGGIVGATLALALSAPKANLKIALIDRRSLSADPVSIEQPWTPRVSALSPTSTNLFKYLDVWEIMVNQRVCPYQQITVWDKEGTGEIQFDSKTASLPELGHIVENEVIRNALLIKLASSQVCCFGKQAEASYQISESGGGKILLSDDIHLEAPLLIAADGGRSRLRQAAGIPINQNDYHHHAVTATVQTESNHNGCASQVFLDTGPLAFLPLAEQNNKHYSAVVWSLLPYKADHIETLTESAFCDELHQSFEGRAGKIIRASPRQRYPLRECHARQYHRQGVVLVGDAAHTIHPLAGLGANLGFMDVAVLSEEILHARERGLNFFSPHILDRYERRRRPHNTAIIKAMTGFQNLFGTNDIRIRWLRNIGLKMVDHLPLLKQFIIQQSCCAGGDLPECVKIKHSNKFSF